MPGNRLTEALRRIRPVDPSAGFGHIEHRTRSRPLPETLPEFELFAVMKTWMDEDVIEATVRNAMAQGCDIGFHRRQRQYRRTVQRAVEHGCHCGGGLRDRVVRWAPRTAAHERRGRPGVVAVRGRTRLVAVPRQRRILRRPRAECRSASTWRPRPALPPSSGLDYSTIFRPASPNTCRGFHPIDFQPLCYEFEPTRAALSTGHWKHPLQRFDRHGQFLLSNDGTHTAYCYDRLIEPSRRDRDAPLSVPRRGLHAGKLELTCGPGSRRTELHARRL